MRLVIAALFALAAAPASAQPVSPAPLAPGEVLLEVDGSGRSVVRADFAKVTVRVTGRGATAAAARADTKARAERLVAAARGVGIAASNIASGGGQARIGFLGNGPPEDIEVGWTAEPPPTRTSSEAVEHSSLEIEVRDRAQFERLRNALEAAGAAEVPEPVYHLRDTTAALRAAKADAVRNARAEADSYAAAMGLRVARLVRVSERSPSGVERYSSMRNLVRMMYGLGASPQEQVETDATVAVDFVLAPQR